MEKNISFMASEATMSNVNKSAKNADSLLKNIVKTAEKPAEWLRSYYATVLEREISMKQTMLLLNAQAAFVMTVFPIDAPILARLICLTWFVKAVLTCKQAL